MLSKFHYFEIINVCHTLITDRRANRKVPIKRCRGTLRLVSTPKGWVGRKHNAGRTFWSQVITMCFHDKSLIYYKFCVIAEVPSAAIWYEGGMCHWSDVKQEWLCCVFRQVWYIGGAFTTDAECWGFDKESCPSSIKEQLTRSSNSPKYCIGIIAQKVIVNRVLRHAESKSAFP